MVLFPGITDEDVDAIVERIMNSWNEEAYKNKIRVEFIKECINFSESEKI